MAKKFGKFLLFSLLAGAAAAGVYYYFKDKNDEDFFEDSEPDVNDDLEEFLKKESEKGPEPGSHEDPGNDTVTETDTATDADTETTVSNREYVPLNFSKEAVAEAEENIIGTPAEEVKPSVEKAADVANDNVSSFSFSSFE